MTQRYTRESTRMTLNDFTFTSKLTHSKQNWPYKLQVTTALSMRQQFKSEIVSHETERIELNMRWERVVLWISPESSTWLKMKLLLFWVSEWVKDGTDGGKRK